MPKAPPVYIVASGGIPVTPVASGAPALAVIDSPRATAITLTSNAAPFVLQGSTPPTPRTSMDHINPVMGGFTNFSAPFDLDTDAAVVYMACEYRGDPVITITHGGEPIEIAAIEYSPPSQISGRTALSLVAVGRNLTTEVADLVVSATGGELDGGAIRIKSMASIDDPAIGWTGTNEGEAPPVSPVIVGATSGGIIKGAFVNMTADRVHSDHITNATEVMNGATVSGHLMTGVDTSTSGPWVLGGGWAKVGDALVHAGASQNNATISIPVQPSDLRAITFRAVVGPDSWIYSDSFQSKLTEGEWYGIGLYSGTSGPMTLTAFGDVRVTDTAGLYGARSMAWIFFTAPAVTGARMDLSMVYKSPWAWSVAEVMGQDV